MACQISYERLNKLFFDSIAFDAKYKSYRTMAERIIGMNLTDESKVTALWYMGLLYNNAIDMDDEIKTEDLPRTVAAIVADKIGEPTSDFKGLYKQVQEVFKPKPADEADLSGEIKLLATDKIIWGHPGLGKTTFKKQNPTGVLDFDTDFKPKVAKKLGLPANKQNSKGLNEWRNDSNKAEFEAAMREVWKEAVTESKKSGKMLVVSDMLFLKENLNDFDKIITTSKETFIKRTTERGDNPEILQSWKSSIDKIIAEIDQSKVIFTNKYFSELAAEGKPEVTEEKPLTLKEKLKAEFNNIQGAKASEFDAIFDKIHNLVKDNSELTKESQLKVFNTLRDVILKNVKKGVLPVTYRVRIESIIKEYQQDNTVGIIDYGEVEDIGKNMYVVRQPNGTVFQALFDETTGKYYMVRFTKGSSLEEYTVQNDDYVTPIYYRLKSYSTDDQGKTVIRNELAKNGIAFSNARLKPELEGYENYNMFILKSNLRPGSVSNQIKIIADRRRVNLNKERSEKYNIEWEHSLRPDQIKALRENPDMPAAAFLFQKSGFQFTISNRFAIKDDKGNEKYKADRLFDYIVTLDNLGFVYADGTTRLVNWNKAEDLELLSKTLMVNKSGTLEAATQADIQVYKEAVAKIKEIKAEIAEFIGDDETYELTPEQVRQYFSVLNSPFSWLGTKDKDITKTVTLSSIKDDLSKLSSTITANVGKIGLGGRVTNITTEEVIGIVRKDINGKLEFVDSLGNNRVVLDENNEPLKGGLRALFLSEGLDEASVLEKVNKEGRYSFLYLTRTSSKGWAVRPLIGTTYINNGIDKISFISSLSALKEKLPEYTAETSQMFANILNSFSENVWGFNAYDGLIANLDYRKGAEGKQDKFFVSVRPDQDYEFLEGLGDKKIIARFEFDFDYATSLKAVKRIASVLKIDYNENGTSEEKIQFGKKLQEALVKQNISEEELQRIVNNPAPASPFENAMSYLIKQYDEASKKLHEQVKKEIDKHQKHVDKGNAPYLNTTKNSLEYLLFSKLNDAGTFKIRDASSKSNPLEKFRAFDRNVAKVDSKFTISFAKPSVINPSIIKKAVPDIAPASSPSKKTEESVKQETTLNKRNKGIGNFKLVDSLKGLKIVGDEEWNKQIDEARRILGNVAKVDEADLSATDVVGKVLGYYENRVITLNNTLKIGGVVYHEAFHAIFRTSLSNEKRSEILGLANVLYGPIKEDYKGKYLEHEGKKVYFDEFRHKRRYIGLSDDFTANLIYEEFLADGFRDYKLNKTEPKNALLKQLYRIIDAIVKLFSSKKYEAAKALNSFYEDIDNGVYANVVADELTSYPRAYELIQIPSHVVLDEEFGESVNYATVSTETYDQLKNRVLHELFKNSFEIGNSRLSFDKVYDRVTKDLIQEYNIEQYIDKKNKPLESQIIEKYGDDFRSMRYILGASHREDVKETFYLKNLTSLDKYENYPYNDEEDSLEVFEEFRDSVFEEYTTVDTGAINYSGVQDEEERTTGDIDEEGADNLQSNDESEVGENFRDDGILTFNPYNGNRNFQKLIKYIKYTYNDPILGVSITKMVNSRTIINSIRKLVLNKSFTQKLPALQNHIDLLKRNVDEFYSDRKLIKSLRGVLPNDLVKMEDEYEQLNAVMEFMKDMAGLDEDFNITKEAGKPFINMFHHVFNYSAAEIDAISVETVKEKAENEKEDDTEYTSSYTKVELLKKSEIEKAKNEFNTNVTLSLLNLGATPVVLAELKESYKGEYETPSTKKEIDDMTNIIYRITTLAQLDIPRYIIEYSVAADVKRNGKSLSKATKEYVESIIDVNKEFYNEKKYLVPSSFLKQLSSLYNSKDFQGTGITNRIENLVKAFVPAIPLLLQYDAGSYDVIVRNLDGKPISKIVPNVPSIEIVNNIKNKGLEETLIKFYGRDFLNYFNDNPFLAPMLENWEYDPNDKSKEGIIKNKMILFFEELKISISGGLTQETFSKETKGTFKALGDKSYMLSMLGLFSNRKRRQFGNNKLITFTRPITQLEATSTQFNVTGLYESYHKEVKSGKETTFEIDNDLVVNKFKQALNQEWNRIKSEWSQRYDYKKRWEGWNVLTITSDENEQGRSRGTAITDDPSLRAYQFSNSKDFFERNDVTKNIRTLLTESAKAGILSFEGALEKLMDDGITTIEEVLSKELISYGQDTFADMLDYFEQVGIQENDIPTTINYDVGKRDDYNNQIIEKENLLVRKGTKNLDELGPINWDKTVKNRKVFLEDFLYNFWFNSMFVNQLFDGDTSVGISNIINYFKRQKAGVAAGPNYRNYSLQNEEEDVTVTATLEEVFGYLDSAEIENPVTALPREINSLPVSWADGQGFTTLLRRIKKFDKAGLLNDDLRAILLRARAGYLTRQDQKILEDHDIILNSDKPVIAGPIDYIKDSEHVILRGDVSLIRPDDLPVVIDLYDQLDAVDIYAPGGKAEYKAIIKEIHQYFTPNPRMALLHTLLNSMEYHMIDVVTDQSARKKGSPSPTLINVNALDNYSDENHPTITIKVRNEEGDLEDKVIPMMEDGYINLEYSSVSVSNDLVYDQVLTGVATEAVGDPIQPKIMLPAQLDDAKFGKEVKRSLKELRKIEEQIATARQEIVNRLFTGGASTPSSLLSKVIQSGLKRQGASTNALKYYSEQNGKNKYNLNLPIHGKAPLYYFFSIFNNNLFGPKVAGEKYYHVSGLGHKLIFDKITGEQISEKQLRTNPNEYLLNRDKYEYRYPSVKIEDDKIVVECFIPRKLGETPEDTRFFEKLYGDYLLGMRIPTELKRSMVVVKVVGYLDAAYSNSIVVPPQVHKWAGSDLDIDALYTQFYAYYRNALGELVKYGDLEPYTDLGLSEDEGLFLEFLHFVKDDIGFKELIDLETDRIKSNVGYNIESLANGAGLFGIDIKTFFEAAEGLAKDELGLDIKESKKTLKSLLNRKSINVGNNKKVRLGKNEAEVIKLLNRLAATINVLNEYEIFGKNKPITVENFKAYVNKNGNPTSPNLHNRALKLKTDILSNPIVYDTFTRNFSADAAIEQYKEAAAILDPISDSSKIRRSNMFTPQTVARVRKLNKNAKQMVGGNASNAKTITMLATTKAKLSEKYTFNFQVEKDGKFKKVDTSKFIEKGPIEVSNSIGFATDDGKNQFAGVLNLFINNSGIMNYMYAVGYDPQFAKLIHSVDLIDKTISTFLMNTDPGYITPGAAPFSFTTTVKQALSRAINENEIELEKLGLLKPSESGKKDEYTINKDAFTIAFTPVLRPVQDRAPSSLGITILDSKGKRVNERVASIVTLHFYNEMLKLSNDISFKLGPISDVLKKIKPSWTAISKIKDSTKFVEDNDVFEGGNIRSLYKSYPVLETLSKQSINYMLDMSKKIILDQTYLFRGITNLFKANRELTEDEIVAELKSIIGLQVLRQYASSEVSKLTPENESGRATFLRILNKTFTTDYWLNQNAVEDLNFLKQQFPNNEFLKSLTSRPALRKSKTIAKSKINVITSALGNKVTPEFQEKMVNDFNFLLTYPDKAVHDAAVNIAIHGIVRDGGMAKQEGYLKVIAPEMFNSLSEQFDKIQDVFYDLDTEKKKINTPEKYIVALNEGLSGIFESTVTINNFMKAILNKLVSSITYDITGDSSIMMSFFQGDPSFPNKGAFSDIELPVFTSIVDTILPKNKQYVYKIENSKIKPVFNLNYNVRRSDTKFELWKADNKGELFFDLTNVSSIQQQEEVARILKRQGIYKTQDDTYSFPLYKVNNFEQGQVFILEELDGKPITESFFKNLFESYKSKDELLELLKGTTAKYAVYKRQGVDRISPNGLTSATASEIYELVNGEKSITDKRTAAKPLPPNLTFVPNNQTILVKDLNMASELKDNRWKDQDREIYISAAGISTYKVSVDRKGNYYVYKRGKGTFFAIYNQLKEESNQKELENFLKRIGFADMSTFILNDSVVKSAISPTPGTASIFTILRYNVNERTSQGVSPDVTAPVEGPIQNNPFKDIPLKNNIEQLNKAVLDLYDANQDLVIHQPGDELTVYFKQSDNDQELELKSFNKTQYGYRVVLSPGGEKQYTYFVDNNGVGEKIEILNQGVFELTPELIAKKDALENKAKQLFEAYQSKANQQVFIQGRFPTFAISPVLENITIRRERGREITVEDKKTIELYRDEPEETTGYKIIIPGHNTQLYLSSKGVVEDLLTGRAMPAMTAAKSIEDFRNGAAKAANNLIKGSTAEESLLKMGFDVTKFYKPEKDLSDVSEFPEAVSTSKVTVEYTAKGQPKRTYTVIGTKIYNKNNEEVFKEDSVDRNKIFANVAIKEGRAVVVEYRDKKYVVNNKNQIISVATGDIMKWPENSGDRKGVIAAAKEKFGPDKFYQEAGRLERVTPSQIDNLQSTVEYQLLNEQNEELPIKGGQSYLYLNEDDARRFTYILEKTKAFPKKFKVTRKITKYERDSKNPLKYNAYNEYVDYYYVKSNNNKKSNLYDIVDKETGEVIATKVRVLSLSKDSKSKIAEDYGLEYKPTKVFSANRSIAFALYRQKPSKAKYIAQAKRYLYDAIKFLNPEESALKINLDRIDDLLNSFPDEMWDYINTTYSPEDSTRINASISLQDQIKFSLPKLGLLQELEKITGIKLQDVSFKNYDRTGGLKKVLRVEWGDIVVIDYQSMTKKQLKAAVSYYLKQKEYFKETSAEENVRKYAEHRGIDYNELRELVFGDIEKALENIAYNETGNSDEMEVSKWRESIRNYDWQSVELFHKPYENFQNTARERITEKFKDKKLANGISHLDYFFNSNSFNWLNINFNNISGDYYLSDMETTAEVGVESKMMGILNPFEMKIYNKPKAGKTFLKEEEVFNRLAAILHEPFHGLHALSYGTKEEIELRKAFDALYNTAFGKEMMDQVFGSGYNGGKAISYDTLYKEFTAFTTQLMLYPQQWINRTDLRSNDIYEFIKKIQTLQDKTYQEVVKTYKKIGTTEKTITEEEKIKLSFLEKLYNYIVSALTNIIPLSKKFVSLIADSRLVEKTVVEDVFGEVEETVTKTLKLPENVRQSKQEFLEAMDELKSAINTLMSIDSKSFSSENIKNFFTSNKFNQESLGTESASEEENNDVTDDNIFNC